MWRHAVHVGACVVTSGETFKPLKKEELLLLGRAPPDMRVNLDWRRFIIAGANPGQRGTAQRQARSLGTQHCAEVVLLFHSQFIFLCQSAKDVIKEMSGLICDVFAHTFQSVLSTDTKPFPLFLFLPLYVRQYPVYHPREAQKTHVTSCLLVFLT